METRLIPTRIGRGIQCARHTRRAETWRRVFVCSQPGRFDHDFTADPCEYRIVAGARYRNWRNWNVA